MIKLYSILKFNLEYRIDKHESMFNRTNWSFFGGGKKFRLNPAIHEGDIIWLGKKQTLKFMDTPGHAPHELCIYETGSEVEDEMAVKYHVQAYTRPPHLQQTAHHSPDVNQTLTIH